MVGNPAGRSSAVFALRSSTKHQADLALFGGEGSVHMSELWSKIKGFTYNVNAQREIRDQQKAHLKAKAISQDRHENGCSD